MPIALKFYYSFSMFASLCTCKCVGIPNDQSANRVLTIDAWQQWTNKNLNFNLSQLLYQSSVCAVLLMTNETLLRSLRREVMYENTHFSKGFCHWDPKFQHSNHSACFSILNVGCQFDKFIYELIIATCTQTAVSDKSWWIILTGFKSYGLMKGKKVGREWTSKYSHDVYKILHKWNTWLERLKSDDFGKQNDQMRNTDFLSNKVAW